MGQSINLLAAALLLGQGQVAPPSKNCACQKQSGGRVVAQPTLATEPRAWSATSEGGWRTTTTSGGRWIDNRPILSKMRNWFRSDDEAEMTTQEFVQPGQGRVIAPSTAGGDYRPLPTITEPPLTESVKSPRRVAPAVVRPAPTTPTKPAAAAPLPTVKDAPVLEIEPLSFRPAGKDAAKDTAKQPATPTIAEIVVSDASAAQPKERNGAISPRFVNKVGQPGDYSWITGQLEIRGNTYVLHYATPDTVDRFGGKLVLQGDIGNLRNGDLVTAHGQVAPQGVRGTVYRARSVDLVER